MFSARPILLALLMLSGAGSLHAEEWSIGSELLGPAPGPRGKAQVASNGHGSLAVWCDGRSFREDWDIVGARLDAVGQPMPTMMIRRGGCSWFSELLVGSNGENFVVVSRDINNRGLYRAEILADDTVREAASLTPTILPSQMVWNGSHFLVTTSYNHSSFTYQAILLDRHGELASGTLDLQEQMRFVVSDGERWMLAVPNRAWILAPSDFPPVGERKAFSKDSFTIRALGLVWDGQNFVTLSTDDLGLTLVLERYDREGRSVGETVSAALPEGTYSEYKHAIVHDGLLEFAYRLSWASPCGSGYKIVRMKIDQHPQSALPEDEIGNRPVRTIRVPPVRTISTICGELNSLFVSPAGPYAVWSETVVYDSEVQIFGRLLGGSESDVLLSAERASPRTPRLASASGKHLVAWVERRKLDEVWFRMIDEDGKPVTPARRLSAPAASIQDLAVTTDGSSFLLAWLVYEPWLSGKVLGTFVSTEGEILQEPFQITPRKFGLLGSAVWNGQEYLVTFGERVYSVTREGTVPVPNGQLIDFHETYGNHQLSTVLARDGDAIFALAEFVNFPPFDAAPVPTWHETIILNENATGGCWSASAVDCVASPWLRWKTEGFGEFATSSRPAFAAGNGHALLVWFENVWEGNGSRLVTRIVGDEHASAGETYDYPPFPRRPHVTWTGSAFIAAIGATVQRFSPTGELLTTTSLGDGALESHVAVGQTGRPIVVFFREDFVPRLMVRPLDDIGLR